MTTADTSRRHADLMDRNYRFQRHIYDFTRKYYLFGRDPMIERMQVPDAGSVLEIGCGTGRNLVLVGRRYQSAQLFGLDISEAMLSTAAGTLARNGLSARTRLSQGDATNFEPKALFGVGSFDRVFISYALSMIPDWQDAIAAALRALSPGGSLHIVDFGQQEGLPGWFKAGLHAWLRNYHVTPRLTLETELRMQAGLAGRPMTFHRWYRGYAWHAVVEPIATMEDC
ncbi:methyltransferase domain-containing protein [Pseudaminobacter sp. 19-2017]|uniref:Methyltransferase domain-containing protein n=1 Tax=Pseudaminobacter soli (ex Zhang et al. 2022) TaxID=2831468 RepID=A0A942DWN9_9HYPH|nr:methyltransferase domain-containing protein [Pseudaminobacter soli]MBS3649164.1 methyltransferase domain-containing protein [Pseudaminobacter soli]